MSRPRRVTKAVLAERARWMRKSHAKKYRDLKVKLLEFLGQKCVCCGETDPAFLTLDHIEAGGRYHRKSKPKTYEVWRDVLNTPEARTKYRLLCWNCNCATRGGKVCPHNRAEVEAFLQVCQQVSNKPCIGQLSLFGP